MNNETIAPAQILLTGLAAEGLDYVRRDPSRAPFREGDAVVHGNDQVTQVLFCEWVPGFREWNVALEDRRRGGVFFLPASHLVTLREYLKARTLTTVEER